MLEIVLALALLGLLLGLAVAAFQGTFQETRSRDYSNRLASLLRASRAEAALTGKRLRLTFDVETAAPLLTIEEDPLTQPGVFVPYSAWWVDLAAPVAGVRVTACALTGGDVDVEALAAGPDAPSRQESPYATVGFYPDGSSDSCQVTLSSEDPDRPWTCQISLNGIDGTVTVHELTQEELTIDK